MIGKQSWPAPDDVLSGKNENGLKGRITLLRRENERFNILTREQLLRIMSLSECTYMF